MATIYKNFFSDPEFFSLKFLQACDKQKETRAEFGLLGSRLQLHNTDRYLVWHKPQARITTLIFLRDGGVTD